VIRREADPPWREAGPPNHYDDKVDSDQYVVNNSRDQTGERRQRGGGIARKPRGPRARDLRRTALFAASHTPGVTKGADSQRGGQGSVYQHGRYAYTPNGEVCLAGVTRAARTGSAPYSSFRSITHICPQRYRF